MSGVFRQQPDSLQRLERRTGQAVVVRSDGGETTVADFVAWERRGDEWQPFLAAAAVIGRSGFISAAGKHEGDGGTPTGVYPLSLVFGYSATAATGMPYRQITADDCWVDDPASPQYNTWVSGKPQAASWEKMLRADGLYRYGVVVEYNTRPVIAGKGSAIFVHLWRGPGEPTSGCVAVAEVDLLKLIAWLAPEKNPVIVIGD
ncbi:L,D-transpeptidase family protein [Anaeroselena agilis]|uniref:L,D-transpeptidase family protein n=1 Tax=Anaeroselena agilis TaxID=3063788 RepID=A0ABU3NUF3_9FIRM|nr:L,D-transpeptidase family protein [Selenomonadales bacterium 4137-cl]